MNMHLVDWGIVAALLAVLVWGAITTKRYTRSVAAFLAAGRGGGRYLIAVAYSMAAVGVISLVALFEQNYKVGYTATWWGLMEGPAMIVMALSGWVIYRYRQTRAMTMAQFFEMRYSRNFRVLAGLVAYLSGIINFGIFPAVGARFFIALCGFPEHFALFGLMLSTFVVTMALLLLVSLTFTLLGGQIAVMVTDFLQGTFCNIVFLVLIVFLLTTFSWDHVSEALLAAPAEESLVHPLHLGEEEHFNIWFYLIGIVIFFYGAWSWQGTQGYYCSAKNAHETKMAGILAGWRMRVLMLIAVVLPICVCTFLQHPEYADQAATVHQSLDALESDTLRNQLRTPLAMAAILPKGLLGLACAAMLAAFISTHDTYLHSWGAILIQDVILPFRKRPFSPRQHLWLLRLSITVVAIFIFFFSLLFQQTQYIVMFFAITGAVFFGGAGSAIIGGLYWKRGSTPAAWAAMLTGMSLSLVKIGIEQVASERLQAAADQAPWGGLASVLLYVKNSLTGQEMTFCAIVAAVLAYILVSLLGPRTVFNMNRLLHRGRYAVVDDVTVEYQRRDTWWEKLGFTKEFSGRDRVATYITLAWPVAWTVIFVAGTVYNLVVDVPSQSWVTFWHGWTWFVLACAAAVTIWFAIGGFIDIRYLFRQLRTRQADTADDGRVDAPADPRVPAVDAAN